MQKTSLICNNFSGINRRESVFSQSVITASDMQNVELFATESNSGVGIRNSKGNVSVCEDIPDGETVINIFESVQGGITYFFVHTENSVEGKVYLFSPNADTLDVKISGLSLTGVSSATDVSQGWKDIWVFSNGEEIYTIEIGNYDEHAELDEVNQLEAVDTEGRPVKGLGLVIFAGRLWIFNRHVLWYSAQENIYDFSTSDAELATSAGYIEFVKNITAIYPYLGSLAVFHSNSSCMIALDDNDGSFYKSYDSPGGCAGYRALVFHGTQLFFYDDTKKGVFSFLQVINGDKTLGENIALDIQNELFTISSSKLNDIMAYSVVTSDRNEIWFLIPEDSENYSTIMIYDYLHNCWTRRRSQKINSIAMIAGRFYSAGKKIYEEYSSDEFDGEFIEAYYKCTPLNLGVENSMKILAYPPKITMDMYSNNNFYVEYTKDYDSATAKLRHITSKTAKDVLYYDKGSWDVSNYAYERGNVIKKLPAAFFRTLQISFYVKNKSQNFCIKSIEFGKIKVKS